MTPEELKAQLDIAWKELKGLLEKQAGEIKQHGETSDSLAQKISAMEAKIDALQSELTEFVRKTAVPTSSGNAPKSLGEQFVGSEEFAQFVQSKGRASAPMNVKSLWLPNSRKALLSTGLESTTQLPYAAFSPIQLERTSIRDLLTVIPTTEGSVEYIRAVGFTPVKTVLTTAAGIGDDDIEVESTNGFFVGQAITVGTNSATVAGVTDATHLAILPALTAIQAIDSAVTSKFIGFVSENSVKPSASFADLSVETATMKTLAVTMDASRQVLADNAQLRALIDNQLSFEVAFSEHYQIIYGNGTSPNISGLLNDSDHQNYSWSDGTVGDTKIDALRRSMTLVTLARYPADGVVMNPVDWEDIELAKGSDGHYLWINITQGGAGATFFRLPVCVTEAIAAGEALVGSFKLAATLYDREQANVRVAEEHSDYFKRNMVAILAEERIALAVNRPEAFVHVTFDSEPV